jgi:hypothetical protein
MSGSINVQRRRGKLLGSHDVRKLLGSRYVKNSNVTESNLLVNKVYVQLDVLCAT